MWVLGWLLGLFFGALSKDSLRVPLKVPYRLAVRGFSPRVPGRATFKGSL